MSMNYLPPDEGSISGLSPFAALMFDPIMGADVADDPRTARLRAAHAMYRAGQEQFAARRAATASGGLTDGELEQQAEREQQLAAAEGERLRSAAAEQIQSARLGLSVPAAASPVHEDPHDPFAPRSVVPANFEAALARDQGRPVAETDVGAAVAAARGQALVEHRNGATFAAENMADADYLGPCVVAPANVLAAMGGHTT